MQEVLYTVVLTDTCGSVHDSLESVKLVTRAHNWETITLVNPRHDETVDY